VLEPGADWCRGCGRTIGEISGWGAMSDSERFRIMALLPDRIAAADKERGAQSADEDLPRA